MRERRPNRGTRATPKVRLLTAVLLAVSFALLSTSLSFARPTKQEVDAAQAKLDSLNNQLSLLVEQYDAATARLHDVELRLQDVRAEAERSKAAADRARADLDSRVAAAYTSGTMGELDALLGSTSLADFTARLEFLNRLAQEDKDAATQADVLTRRAKTSASELAKVLDQRQALVDSIQRSKQQIQASIPQQEALVHQLTAEFNAPPPPPPAAKAAPATTAATSDPAPSQSGGGSGGGGGGDPGPSSGAAAAVAEAWNLIGIPYVWGSGDPNVGLDCSGLTMVAWQAGGVSLPHSSQMQYNAVPHVSRSAIQPGDLLFFYSPIHHVAIYVGNNTMIHATHPGELSHAESISSYWWDIFVGAGRPGA
jgi:cell wall-associated NlpC family hydrolase